MRASDHSYGFHNLSFEIHAELVSYLTVQDLISISQTCSELRLVYQGFSWRHCDVLLASIASSKRLKNSLGTTRRVIPIDCFNNPRRFRWLQTHQLHDVRIVTTIFDHKLESSASPLVEDFLKLTKDLCPADQDAKKNTLYSALESLSFSHFLTQDDVPLLVTIPGFYRNPHFSIPLEVLRAHGPTSRTPLLTPAGDLFSHLKVLKLVGDNLFISNLPADLHLNQLERLLIFNVRAPLLTFMVNLAATGQIPKLRVLGCEIGVYQRNNSIYVQANVIEELAKVPENIEYCFLRISHLEGSGYTRLGTQETPGAEVASVATINSVKQLELLDESLDPTLLGQLLKFPQLKFLELPEYSVTSPFTNYVDFSHYNTPNLIKVSTHTRYKASLQFNFIRSYQTLEALRFLRIGGVSKPLLPFVPELFPALMNLKPLANLNETSSSSDPEDEDSSDKEEDINNGKLGSDDQEQRLLWQQRLRSDLDGNSLKYNIYFEWVLDFITEMYQDPVACYLKFINSSWGDYGKIMMTVICFGDLFFYYISKYPKIECVLLDILSVRFHYPSVGLALFVDIMDKLKEEGKPSAMNQIAIALGSTGDVHNRSRLPAFFNSNEDCSGNIEEENFFSHECDMKEEDSEDLTLEQQCQLSEESNKDGFTYNDDMYGLPSKNYYISVEYGMYLKYPYLLKARHKHWYVFLLDFKQRRQFYKHNTGGINRGEANGDLSIDDFFSKDFCGWI